MVKFVKFNDEILKSQFHPLAGTQAQLKKKGKKKSQVLIFGMTTTIPNIYIDFND